MQQGIILSAKLRSMHFISYNAQTAAAPEGNPPINAANHIPPVQLGSDNNFVNGKNNTDINWLIPLYEIKADNIINGNSEGKSVSLQITTPLTVAENTRSEK